MSEVYHYKDEWVATSIDEIQIDVHLKSGVVTMPLPFFIDLIYPLIRQRVDKEMAIEFSGAVQIDGKQIAKALFNG